MKEFTVEQAVLGGFLLEEQSKHIERLKPELFTTLTHQMIAKTIRQLSDESKPYDMVSISAQIDEKICKVTYLTDLLDAVVTTAMTSHYLSILEDRHNRRTLKRLATELIEKSTEGERGELGEVIETMTEQLVSHKDNPIKTISSIIDESLDGILREVDGRGRIGLSTGLETIDRVIRGLSQGTYIIAGRPSTGKTTMAINWMMSQAKEGHRVGLISLEMTSERVLSWMIDHELRADHLYTPTGGKRTDWASEIITAAGKIDKLQAKIVIDDTPYTDVADVLASAHKMRFDNKIEVLYIDYLQLLETRGRNDNREREVATISRKLTALKKKLGIPIVILAQLNRRAMLSEDRRPKLFHLRESGALEQDADVVLMLHDPIDGEYHELSVVKNRSGRITGNEPIQLIFNKAGKRFEMAVSEKEFVREGDDGGDPLFR